MPTSARFSAHVWPILEWADHEDQISAAGFGQQLCCRSGETFQVVRFAHLDNASEARACREVDPRIAELQSDAVRLFQARHRVQHHMLDPQRRQLAQ